MNTITCYLVIAKFDYGIDFWLGGVSSDEDCLMAGWELYLEEWHHDNAPEFIGIHEVEHTVLEN